MPKDQPAPTIPAWGDLGLRDLWGWPLSGLHRRSDRLLLRLAVMLARGQVKDVSGWWRVLPEHDPFILVANHGSRREALYLAAALMLVRGGRPVHFLADWTFGLIPGVGYLYAASGTIVVNRKAARPRVLNRFRPPRTSETAALRQARTKLEAGVPIALFPEGTVNRDPERLLRGRFGAARLSLETATPILPVGIRFLGEPLAGPRTDYASPAEIRIGAPLPAPPRTEGPASISEVRGCHAQMMTAIAALAAKRWDWSAQGTTATAAGYGPSAHSGPMIHGDPHAQET